MKKYYFMNIIGGCAVCLIIFQSIILCYRRHEEEWSCRERSERPRIHHREDHHRREHHRREHHRREHSDSSTSSSASSSSSSSSSSNHHDTSTRVDQHIQLIQNVILQATINIEQTTKFFTEELKTLLIEGLGIINGRYLAKISKDFKRLEEAILEVVCRLNEDILRDTEALVIKSNEELQDAIIIKTKETNKKIISDFDSIIVAPPGPPGGGPAPPGPPPPVVIDKEGALVIIQKNLGELIERAVHVFKKVTNIEKALLNKIIKEKKDQELCAITKLIEDFERILCGQFKELICESESFIHQLIVENTHKFVVALESLFNKIGQNIISVLKGCDVDLRPTVGIDTSSLIRSRCNAVGSHY